MNDSKKNIIASKNFVESIKKVPNSCGVYKIFDINNRLLYIGKAKSLSQRTRYYLSSDSKTSSKIKAVISKAERIEVIETDDERSALLMEASLVRNLKPRYNTLLRDDRSYPYLIFREGIKFPKITKRRGMKSQGERFFGPFISTKDLSLVIEFLQKSFKLRTCSDIEFKSRKRPCVEYEMDRCSAPCTGIISQIEYVKLAKKALKFLSRDNKGLKSKLEKQMKKEAKKLHYEEASRLHKTINILNILEVIHSKYSANINNADFIGIAEYKGRYSAHVISFRNYQNCNNRSFFVENAENKTEKEIIETILPQIYCTTNQEIPDTIFIPSSIPISENLYKVLSFNNTSNNLEIKIPHSDNEKRLLQTAIDNANSIIVSNKEHAQIKVAAKEIAEILSMDYIPRTFEFLDNSHLFGSDPYGVLIAADIFGINITKCRKYPLKSTKGDDVAMTEETLQRRFLSSDPLPDLFVLDGGIPQAKAAISAAMEYNVDINFICIAKGKFRNAGNETFINKDKQKVNFSTTTKLFLKKFRDKAHLSSVRSHRNKRERKYFLQKSSSANTS